MEIERVQRPFWAHQLVEYLIGVVLLSVAIQQPQPVLPALLGLLVLVNAAVARGAAGAFRLVGKRLHRILDLVVIGLLVLGAVQPWISLDNLGRMVLGAVAFVLFFVWFHTDFSEAPPRPQPSRSSASTGPSPTSAASAARSSSTSETLGHRAGRIVGSGINSFRRWREQPDDDGDR